jgi:hypothetical protein
MTAQGKVEAATLHAAMAQAFAEIDKATKAAVNPAFKQGGKVSKYADLGAVIDAIKPALIKHSLFFTQHCQPSDGGVTVETFLHHASGESMSMGSLFVPANKRDPQGFGSALTYARRYALQTAFGVPTEDDDGNAAVRAMSAPAEEPKRTAAITDAQRDLIATLAPATGKTLQEICEAYRVGSLKELTEAQAVKLIERLQPSKQTENA